MRFLIEKCAGRKLAEWLRAKGHDVLESRERGEDPGDATVLDWVANEKRILITMDKDFGELIFKEKSLISDWADFRMYRSDFASSS